VVVVPYIVTDGLMRSREMFGLGCVRVEFDIFEEKMRWWLLWVSLSGRRRWVLCRVSGTTLEQMFTRVGCFICTTPENDVPMHTPAGERWRWLVK
jgi:3'-phosphoadenosine 5'-phosphosulfate sulfotransferase (PAPS reductase)/FAD synthetase